MRLSTILHGAKEITAVKKGEKERKHYKEFYVHVKSKNLFKDFPEIFSEFMIARHENDEMVFSKIKDFKVLIDEDYNYNLHEVAEKVFDYCKFEIEKQFNVKLDNDLCNKRAFLKEDGVYLNGRFFVEI